MNKEGLRSASQRKTTIYKVTNEFAILIDMSDGFHVLMIDYLRIRGHVLPPNFDRLVNQLKSIYYHVPRNSSTELCTDHNVLCKPREVSTNNGEIQGKRNSENSFLTHWGRVTHICVGKLTIIGSDNGLSPERRQAIIWTNAGILLIGPLGTNFSEI